MDRTGNLRGSIGYIIVRDGKIEQLQIVPGATAKGKKECSSFLQELSKSHKSGIVLIVVAGMNYAEYVESIHGLDVLTSAELYVKSVFPSMMRQLGYKV